MGMSMYVFFIKISLYNYDKINNAQNDIVADSNCEHNVRIYREWLDTTCRVGLRLWCWCVRTQSQLSSWHGRIRNGFGVRTGIESVYCNMHDENYCYIHLVLSVGLCYRFRPVGTKIINLYLKRRPLYLNLHFNEFYWIGCFVCPA